jgi:hypothetical protein
MLESMKIKLKYLLLRLKDCFNKLVFNTTLFIKLLFSFFLYSITLSYEIFVLSLKSIKKVEKDIVNNILAFFKEYW